MKVGPALIASPPCPGHLLRHLVGAPQSLYSMPLTLQRLEVLAIDSRRPRVRQPCPLMAAFGIHAGEICSTPSRAADSTVTWRRPASLPALFTILRMTPSRI